MPIDPDKFLCERCGYELAGIEPEMPCPECGMPVAASQPERRTGSPWQRGPGPIAWARTVLLVLFQPRKFWRIVRPEPGRSLGLLAVNLAVSVAMIMPILVSLHASMLYIASFFVVGIMLLAALTSIEFTGIRFLGARHGYRVTAAVALSVVGHASVGWLISGVGVTAAGVVLKELFASMRPFPRGVQPFALIAAVFGPIIVAMVVFSLLSGVGYHAMRFANRPRANRPAAQLHATTLQRPT